jgi:hypothetical protein
MIASVRSASAPQYDRGGFHAERAVTLHYGPGTMPVRIKLGENIMLYRIVLSALLVILSLTGSRTVQADSAETPPQTIEQQAPAFRAFEGVPGMSTALDARIPDASLQAIADWLSQNFELPASTQLPRIEFAAPAQMYQMRCFAVLVPTKQVNLTANSQRLVSFGSWLPDAAQSS